MVLRPSYNTDWPHIIRAFIRSKAEKRGAVVGISGGLDSSVVAALCASALGPERVRGIALPVGKAGTADADDAGAMARRLKIKFERHDIGPVLSSFDSFLNPQSKIQNPKSRIRAAGGNLAARVRMAVLYLRANQTGSLVMGTGNKSELLTGYFTKFGDGGADYLPIGDLYKTQVRALAREIGIPHGIIKKVPTAGLWPGQTDEGELGIAYETLDRILLGIETRMEHGRIAKAVGVPVSEVERIAEMVEASRHKRRLPQIPKLGIRTVGVDWRE